MVRPAVTRVPVRAFWCRVPSRPNFGDALTPWLIRRLTGLFPRFSPIQERTRKYVVTGSIAAMADSRCTVWGAGIMSRGDDLCPSATFLAVRGPLTRQRALDCGADCPQVLGDPGLLLSRLHPARVTRRYGVGIAPHFADRPHLCDRWSGSSEVRMIDMQDPVDQVADAIASCELVVTSSLHGVIASHSYGVPVVWVQFRPLPSGDGSKFDDHFLAVGLDPKPPVPAKYDHVDVDELGRRTERPPMIDVERLWRSCPFREVM